MQQLVSDVECSVTLELFQCGALLSNTLALPIDTAAESLQVGTKFGMRAPLLTDSECRAWLSDKQVASQKNWRVV